MLKFFRQLRYSFVFGEKTGKYLTYATGEIVLVVIGILIALGINDWKQNITDRETEKFYLNNLLGNLTEDEQEMKIIIAHQKTREAIRDSLYQLLSDVDTNLDKIDSLYKSLADYSLTFFENSSAFNALKMSGDFSKIHNKNLQLKLSSLYEKVYYRITYNGELYDQRIENTAAQIMHFYDWEGKVFTNPDYLRDGTVKNITAFEQDYNRYYISLLTKALEEIAAIKEIIEEELIK